MDPDNRISKKLKEAHRCSKMLKDAESMPSSATQPGTTMAHTKELSMLVYRVFTLCSTECIRWWHGRKETDERNGVCGWWKKRERENTFEQQAICSAVSPMTSCRFAFALLSRRYDTMPSSPSFGPSTLTAHMRGVMPDLVCSFTSASLLPVSKLQRLHPHTPLLNPNRGAQRE
jgi:hypothetical protein